MESLIAAKILIHKIEHSDNEMDVQWLLNRKFVNVQKAGGAEHTKVACYKLDSYWDGINLK